MCAAGESNLAFRWARDVRTRLKMCKFEYPSFRSSLSLAAMAALASALGAKETLGRMALVLGPSESAWTLPRLMESIHWLALVAFCTGMVVTACLFLVGLALTARFKD